MSATNDTGRSGKPVTVRIATWSARHRWPVFVLWFVFTIGLFATSVAMGGTRTIQATQASGDTTESGIAESTFNASGSGTPHEEFVLVISSADRSGHRSGLPRDGRRTSWPRSAARRMRRAQPCSPSSSIPTAFPPRPGSSRPTAQPSGSSARSAAMLPRSRPSWMRSAGPRRGQDRPRRLRDPCP